MERSDDAFSAQSMRGYRLTILSQLSQAAGTLHHPGEMFQWMASATTQRLRIPVFQLWTCMHGRPSQQSAQLWAMACDNSYELPVTVRKQIAITVENISREQSSSSCQSVEQIFPQYLASLLKRHGFHYCAYCLVNRYVCLPTTAYALSLDHTPQRLKFIALLFVHRNPGQELVSTISFVFEQAIILAENRRLLLPDTVSIDDHLSTPPVVMPQKHLSALPALSALSETIPRLKQSAGLLLSNNPFARSVNIVDKQALRLYNAIDGRKTVAELCRILNISPQTAHMSLQMLLSLQYVEMYTPEGVAVDINLLSKDR